MEENDVVCSPKNFVAGVPVRFLLHYCSSSPYWPLTFRTTSLKFSCCVSSKTCLFVTLALSLLSTSASTLKFRKKKKKVVFFFSLKVWVAKMTITWTSIIKLNTSCRFDRESKRSFQIGYSVVPMGHVRSPDHQKFLGSMDTNFFLPTVHYCEHRSSSTIPDSRFAHQMKPHLSYL